MQYSDRQSGHKLLEIDDHSFNITFKHENPIKKNKTQKIIRECLIQWLENKQKK